MLRINWSDWIGMGGLFAPESVVFFTGMRSLNAVKASKRFPPPNFLIMLGNRYGWVPLPYAIGRREFEAICRAIEQNGNAKAAEIIENLCKLYVLDTNHLVERISVEMVPAHILIQRQGALADQQKWQAIESFYRPHLQMAADRLFQDGQLDASERDKYFSSLTEQEIHHGLGEMDKGQSFAILRDITGGTAENAPAFIENNPRLDRLKAYIKDILPPDNIYSMDTAFSGDTETPNRDERYLTRFAEKVEDYLRTSIDAYIKQVEETEQSLDHELIEERSQHEGFRDEKLKIFFGREDTLRVIDDYLDAPGSTPLIIHGRSGMGKSALMARAIKAAQDRQTAPVIYRFVGASAASSDIRSLLISLIEDLAAHGLVSMPDEFETDINKYNSQIAELLSAISEPVMLFIDALDQLQKQDFLNWLPDSLPDTVKLILAVLNDEDHERDSQYFHILRRKYGEANSVSLEALGADHATDMLKALQQQAGRLLTPQQTSYLLASFDAAGASPLFLRTAFEIAKSWHGWDEAGDEPGQKVLAANAPALIAQFLLELVSEHHHDRKMVARTLGYLAAARFGLSEKELTDILSRDDEVMAAIANEYHENKSGKLPPSVWTRLEAHLAAFLVEKQIDGQPLLHFFHRQINKAVATHYYREEKQLLHEKLAAYFESLNRQEGERARYNIRALSELPNQLHESGQLESLKAILLDPAFMEDRLAAHGIQPLIEDYHAYGEKAGRAAKLTGRALTLSVGPLERDTQHLFPQLLGRLSEIHGPEIERLMNRMRLLIVPPILVPRRPTLTSVNSMEINRFEVESPVNALALLLDGRLACGDENGEIWLWNVTSGKRSLLGHHTGSVNTLAVLVDGKLASASDNNIIHLWNTTTGESTLLEGHVGGVSSLVSFPNGKLASASSDRTIRIWDIANGSSFILEVEEDGKGHVVKGLAILPSNKLASAYEDGTIRLWDVDTGKNSLLNGSWLRDFAYMTNTHLLPSVRRVITKYLSFLSVPLNIFSGLLKFLEAFESAGTAQKLKNISLNACNNTLGVLPDGKLLSTGSVNSQLWDIETRTCEVLESLTGIGVFTVFPNGRLASALNPLFFEDERPEGRPLVASISIVDLETDKKTTIEGHGDMVTSLIVLPDGRLASASKDRTIRIWDMSNEDSPEQESDDDKRAVEPFGLLADGRLAGQSNSGIRIWDIATYRSEALDGIGKNETLDIRGASVTALATLSDGRLASAS